MSDLTDRLRAMSFVVCGEAADEIDRLRVTVKMLMDDKAALMLRVAGLEQDAARWRTFIGLPYNIRSEWVVNLSIAAVLTQWVDQAITDAALKGEA